MKSPLMADLESRHGGRAIEKIVADAITTHGNVDRAADALGINRKTFHGWVQRLRIQRKTVALIA